jgi:DDE family transposase
MSQHARPRSEPAFGWLKTIAWIRKVKLRGLAKVDWLFELASAAFNLIRLPNCCRNPHDDGDVSFAARSPVRAMDRPFETRT